MNQQRTVLFVCVHNAGRSQMAAGWVRHFAGDRVQVLSGGSAPAKHINPVAVEAMAEVGIDIASQHPRPVGDDDVRAADAVITMGCGDACPVYPGRRYEDWPVDDPAGRDRDAVRGIRDDIRRRVERLLAEIVPAGDADDAHADDTAGAGRSTNSQSADAQAGDPQTQTERTPSR